MKEVRLMLRKQQNRDLVKRTSVGLDDRGVPELVRKRERDEVEAGGVRPASDVRPISLPELICEC